MANVSKTLERMKKSDKLVGGSAFTSFNKPGQYSPISREKEDSRVNRTLERMKKSDRLVSGSTDTMPSSADDETQRIREKMDALKQNSERNRLLHMNLGEAEAQVAQNDRDRGAAQRRLDDALFAGETYFGTPDTQEYKDIAAEIEAAKKALADFDAFEADYQRARSLQYEDAGQKALAGLNEITTQALDQYIEARNAVGTSERPSADAVNLKKVQDNLVGMGYTVEEIEQLADYRQRQKNRAEYDLSMAEYEEYAKAHPVASSAKSIPMNLAGGVGYLDLALQELINPDRPADYYAPSMRFSAGADTIRQTVSEEIEANTDWEIADVNVASFLYNTGMSMADSTAVALLSAAGVPGASALLGGAAATSAARQAKERGGTDEQALMYGLWAGIAEGFFEKYSLERILKTGAVSGDLKQKIFGYMKNFAIQGFTEGSEEVFTTIANTIGDALIMGDISEFETIKQLYVTKGRYSEEEAYRLAVKDWISGLVQDFAGGILSGGVMGSATGAINTVVQNARYRQAGKDITSAGNRSAIMDLAMSLKESSPARQAASKMDSEKASNRDIGRLYYDIQRGIYDDAIRARMAELGISDKEAEITAMAINKVLEGEDLSRKEKKAYGASSSAQQIVSEFEQEGDPVEWVQRLDRTRSTVAGIRRGAWSGKSLADIKGTEPTEALDNEIKTQDIPEEAVDILRQIYKAEGSPADARQLVSDFKLAYYAGRNGVDAETISISDSKIFKAAYSAGVAAADKAEGSSFKTGANVQYTAAALNRAAVQLAIAQTGKSRSKDVAKAKTFLKQQIAIIGSFAKKYNRRVIFENSIDMKGKDGKVRKSAANAYLDERGDIHIALDSTTQLYTAYAIHELVHDIKRRSEMDYDIIKEYALEALKKNGQDFEALVKKQMDKFGYSREVAEEEVIANTVPAILSDEETIRQMAQTNRGLLERIGEWIRDFISHIEKAFNRLSKSESFEQMEALKGDIESLRKIRDALFEALEDTKDSNSIIEDGGVVENESGEPVAFSDGNGGIKLSQKTYEESGRAVLEKYLNGQVKKKQLTRQDADDMLAQLDFYNEKLKEIGKKYDDYSKWAWAEVEVDDRGNPVLSVVKANGDYAMNLDFSLVCKKRRALDAVFSDMIKRGIINDYDLEQEQIVQINDIIREHGLETACAICFVESKRFRQANVADDFVNLYNEIVESMAKGGQEIDHFDFGGNETLSRTNNGIDKLKNTDVDLSLAHQIVKEGDASGETKNVRYAVAKHLLNNPQDRKLLDRGDFMNSNGFLEVSRQRPEILKLYNRKKGSGGPKASFGDVQYLNEIIKKRTFNAKKAYAVGGVRIQSFSDYIAGLVFDYMQMVGDLAAKKLPAHSYTKEELFVRQFGLTGVKINMSLVPKVVKGYPAGLGRDGYAWAGESFDFDTAVEIQSDPEYGKNCGTICVGVSNEHIDKLLDDDRIRMVIPYHKSSLNPIVAKMNKIDQFKDYTLVQSTRYSDGTKLEKADAAKEPNFNELLREYNDPKAAADAYLDWCNEHGYLPKFDKWAGHENYYKLLTDFALYDEAGNYQPQGAVHFTFPTESSAFGGMMSLIERGLEEHQGNVDKISAERSKIVDEIQERLEKKGRKFSLKDEEYLEAVQNNDMQKAQKLVDEAAKAAGYDGPLYHGTRDFGFTVIDTSVSDDGMSFFATDSIEVADTYSGQDEKKVREIHEEGNTFEDFEEHEEAYYDDVRSFVSLVNKTSGYYNFLSYEDAESQFGKFERSLIDEGKTYDDVSSELDEYIEEIVNSLYEQASSYEDELTLEGYLDSDEVQDVYSAAEELYSHLKYFDDYSTSQEEDGNYKLYANTDGLFEIDAKGRRWNNIPFDEYDPYGLHPIVGTRELARYARYEGYKGVKISNLFDDGGRNRRGQTTPATVYIFFDPQKQVKSADPVTYDEDGNVIPLSKRFDPDNVDIRFSLRDDPELVNDVLSAYPDMDKVLSSLNTQEATLAGRQMTDAQINRYVRRWLKANEVKADYDAEILTKDMSALFRDFYKSKKMTAEEFAASGAEIMRTALEKARSFNSEAYEADSDIRSFLRSGKIKLTDVQKQDVESVFDSVGAYKKAGRGKFRISDDGEALDVVWQSLSERRSDLFPTDVAEGDMPVELMAAAHALSKENYYFDAFGRNLDEASLESFLTVVSDLTENPTIRRNVREMRAYGEKQYKAAEKEASKQRIAERKKLSEEYNTLVRMVEGRAKHEERKKSDAKLAQKQAIIDRYRNLSDKRKQQLAVQRELFKQRTANLKQTEKKSKLRSRIKKNLNEITTWLMSPTDKKHVPEALRTITASFIESIDLYGDRKASERWQSRMLKLHDYMARADAAKMEDESGVYFNVDEAFLAELKEFIGENEDSASVWDMDEEQLKSLDYLIEILKNAIQTVNSVLIDGKWQAIGELADSTLGRAEAKGPKFQNRLQISRLGKLLSSGNLKPWYFFKNLGDKSLKKLYNGLRDAQKNIMFDSAKAKSFFRETAKKYHANEWLTDDNKNQLEFTTTRGQKVKLTRDLALSIYATAKREAANAGTTGAAHLSVGGFVLNAPQEVKDGKKTRMVEDRRRYPLSDVDLQKILNWLTPDQKAFADELVRYMSEDLSALGNQTSVKLSGYKKFLEKYYFPYKVSSDYRVTDPGKSNDDNNRWKHWGAAKATVKGANAPIVLEDFTKVFGDHVNEMLTYAHLAIPQENFVRVYNYKGSAKEDGAMNSVKAAISTAYGVAAKEYIDHLLTDLGGGFALDPRESNPLFSRFKKAAVLGSLSVAIQQPSAIVRAAAMVDLKYFIGKPKKDAFEEAMKYAGTAMAKRVGGFDTGTSHGLSAWIAEMDPTGFKEKGKAIFSKDSSYRDNILGWLPEKMDELTWGAIWEAVKREVKADTGLTGKELLEAAGKRFDDVIDATQVYDSTLSRSDIMRSKSGAVKMVTSFMAEPTVSYNMLSDAVMHARDKNYEGKLPVGKTLGAVIGSTVLNSLLKGIVYAMRDDDEDQTLLEKYAETVAGSLIGEPIGKYGYITGDLSPLTMIPYIRDVVSIFQGYDVERADMSLVQDLVEAIKVFGDENKSWETRITTLAGAVSNLCGVPFKNVYRDVKAVFKTFNQHILNGSADETDMDGLIRSIESGLGIEHSTAYYARMLSGTKRGSKQAQKALDGIEYEYKLKVETKLAEGKKKADAESEAKTAVKQSCTDIFKPLYQAAKTADEKAAIRQIVENIKVGGKSLYGTDYDFAKKWKAE